MRFLWLPLLALALSAQVVVNDVTQLNPIRVARVVAPTTLEQIVAEVKAHSGPVSIGGGRYSMGGQTATENALQIDMRQFDKVLSLDVANKEITVQAGITWRKIQERIDPHNLSLSIMQSYSNFTVGGALSVNAHGRYMGLGPAVLSVKSIRLVLANGDIVTASPRENSELFYGAIGGYGGLGVIAEATLRLAPNVAVQRQSAVMPLAGYGSFFQREIKGKNNIIFHNADIYPTTFDTVRAISFVETKQPVTVPDRLMSNTGDLRFTQWLHVVNSEWPGGKLLRQHLADPLTTWRNQVVWRNYEASYDVRDLEPASRADSTYVLQEFFVPVAQLDSFAPKMAEILQRNNANTINVSIRHALPDPGTLLAWARQECFAFVLYYKQGTSPAARRHVARWTRELMDAAIAHQGAYYLPYQIWGLDEQFHAAYPRAQEYFALKAKVDPTYKFRNKLWDAYYRPAGYAPALPGQNAPADLGSRPDYRRDEAQTYLTLPEWYLVFNPEEYAAHLTARPASSFPYFASVAQFWETYRTVIGITTPKYPLNSEYHVMVGVIGASFTIENIWKGLYENTIGRLAEFTNTAAGTDEDRFAADVARQYAQFLHATPWYDFPYFSHMLRLWRDVPLWGGSPIRKLERRIALSFEYLVKAQYALIIRTLGKAMYGEDENEILALVENESTALARERKLVLVERFADASLVSLPRYDEFGHAVRRLVPLGLKFREIAGNRDILITVTAPAAWQPQINGATPVLLQPVLSDASRQRVGLKVNVPQLHTVLPELERNGVTLEHIFDY